MSGPQPLRIELDLDLFLHAWDADTGAFTASVGEGMLERRPASDEAWDVGGHGESQRWSDGRWD